LGPRLQSATQEALRILKVPEPPLPPPTKVRPAVGRQIRTVQLTGVNRESTLRALRNLLADYEASPTSKIIGNLELWDDEK
jgi:hypothetical protein